MLRSSAGGQTPAGLFHALGRDYCRGGDHRRSHGRGTQVILLRIASPPVIVVGELLGRRFIELRPARAVAPRIYDYGEG
jgi:hypothetical protein